MFHIHQLDGREAAEQRMVSVIGLIFFYSQTFDFLYIFFPYFSGRSASARLWLAVTHLLISTRQVKQLTIIIIKIIMLHCINSSRNDLMLFSFFYKKGGGERRGSSDLGSGVNLACGDDGAGVSGLGRPD